jgi:hypothetical protein
VVSTPPVVLQVLIFLYRHVRKQPCPELGEIAHVRQSRRVPVVRARQEVPKVLAHLVGIPHLLPSLLYGAGLASSTSISRIGLKTLWQRLSSVGRELGRRPQVAKAEVEHSGAPSLQCKPLQRTMGDDSQLSLPVRVATNPSCQRRLEVSRSGNKSSRWSYATASLCTGRPIFRIILDCTNRMAIYCITSNFVAI